MNEISVLLPVKDEGRWLLITEKLFMEMVDSIGKATGDTFTVDWGSPDTRLVTFHTPTVTVHHGDRYVAIAQRDDDHTVL